MKLTAHSIRTWDHSGRSSPTASPSPAWPGYTIGGIDALTDVLDALPDSVVEHHPGGLKSLQNLRRSWIKTNRDLADAYAKRIGLLK